MWQYFKKVSHDSQIGYLEDGSVGIFVYSYNIIRGRHACQMLDATLARVAGEGWTIVMTSHDLARAAGLASRFDVLTRGSIQASVQRADLPEDGLLAFYRQTLEISTVEEAA